MRALFEKFLAGDDTAFAELYREMNPRLSAYCWKLVGSRAGSTAPRVDDLMQELWERVIAMRTRSQAGSAAPRGKDGTAPRDVESPLAFLFRMLKNLVIDEHRKEKNEIALNDEMADESHVTHQSYSTKLEGPNDIECIILEALEKLSDDDREILILNIYSGYKYGEIAEMLSATPEAVWQRASRARTKLRKIVIDDANRMGVALPKMNSEAKKAQKNQAVI